MQTPCRSSFLALLHNCQQLRLAPLPRKWQLDAVCLPWKPRKHFCSDRGSACLVLIVPSTTPRLGTCGIAFLDMCWAQLTQTMLPVTGSMIISSKHTGCFCHLSGRILSYLITSSQQASETSSERPVPCPEPSLRYKASSE